MNTVAVIDYGMGNLHSVAKALEHVAPDGRVLVTHEPEKIFHADRIVLPGVGAMRDCMGEIKRLGIDQVVHEVIKNKPFLGVCVGMQALMDFSDENEGVECLGILPGKVEYFGNQLADPETGERLKVPHMGWNQVHQLGTHPLWKGIEQDARFYFVHSYYVKPNNESLTAASTSYGFTFTSVVAQNNVFAVQFHPEKSQHAGLTLYANFIRWDGELKG